MRRLASLLGEPGLDMSEFAQRLRLVREVRQVLQAHLAEAIEPDTLS